MGRRADPDSYRGLFEGMLDGAVVLDAATGRVVLGNTGAARLFGVASPDALEGLNPLDHVPEEDRETAARLLAQGRETDGGSSIEFRLITADSKETWASARGTAIKHRGRKAILATIRDITAEKERAATLRDTDRRYEQLFDRMLDGAVVLDIATFKIAWASRVAAAMFGFASPQEAVGQNPVDYIPEEDRNLVIQRIAANLEGTDKSPSEWRMMTRDGRRIWISASATEIEYEGRQAIVSTMRDITAEKEREAALREAEHRYGSLFDGMLDGALVLDVATFTVALVNKAGAAMFGFASPQEMIGENPMEYIPGEDHDRIIHMIAGNIEGRHKQTAELQVITRDKKRVWISATATQMQHEGRAAIIATMRDITADKAKDAALRMAEESKMQVIEAAREAIFIFQDEKIAYVNPAAANGVGLLQHQMVGLPLLDMVHPDHKQEIAGRYHKTVAGHPFSGVTTTKGVTSQGETRWADIQAIPYTWQGRPAVMALVTDVTDRVLAGQAVVQEKTRLRAILSNAWDGVAIFDRDYRVVFESPALARITGFSPEEWTGLTPDKFRIHPDDQGYLFSHLEELRRHPGSVVRDVIIRYQHKDGSWRTMEAAGCNLLEDPDVRGMVINFRDITERQQAEESLRQSEALLRTTQEIALVGGWDYDVQSQQTHWTEQTYRIHELPGLPGIDHIAESLKCFPPMDRQLVREAFRQCVQQGTPFDLAVPFTTFKGERRWVRVMARAVREGEKTIRVVGNIADITERKTAEEKMLASEERYRKVVETASEAIAVLQDGVIKFANPKAASVTGYTLTELSLRPFLDLVHPDDRQEVADHYVMKQRGAESPGTYQFRFVDKSGNTGWAEANVTLLIWDGRLATLLLMSIITERKMIEEALKDREARYRGLFEGTQTAIQVVSVETGLVVLANTATARMFGFASPDDLVGINPVQFLSPEDRDRLADRAFAAAVEAASQEPIEMPVLTKDGRRIWISGVAAGTDYQGQPALLFSFLDITQRKEAEAALKTSEERFRTLIDESTDAIIILDADARISYQSPSTKQVSGFMQDEYHGSSLPDWDLHPDDIPATAAVYGRVMREPNATVSGVTARFKHADGTWHTLEATMRNLLHDPKVGGMVINYRDITERVQAEQALRNSEERFRALIEKASDAIMVLDEDGKVQYYSPSIGRTTGYGENNWDGLPMNEWRLHPDDLARASSLLAKVLQEPGMTIEGVKARYMHKDGTWHTVEAMVRNMLHDPTIKGIVANFRDITERVKAEQAVRESEERYRLLAENISDVIWVVDMGLKPTYVSPSAQRMLGYTAEQFMAGSLESMLTPQSVRVALKAFSKALAREAAEPGIPWETPPLDLQFIRANGSTLWAATNFSYIRGPDGKPAALLGVLKDITEQKKAEESLRRSEERFRSLVETSSDWVWEFDAGNRYTYVSPKVRDILGHEPQDLLGRTPFDFMPQREGRRVTKILRRFATEHLPFSLLEYTAAHKDGRGVVLETSAVPIRDSSGRPAGYRGISRDITERKKVEQELQRSLKRLEKTMESTIEAITTTIETRDPYTTGHQMRVTDLACALARVMEVPPEKIEGIRVAGLLHDIGKIAVPTEILSKPGKLNEVEYEMIKTHAKTGYNILKRIEFPWPVARTVLQHHERWNGSGYPYGLRGEAILLEARILAVADVMEAMSSHRPYRPSIGADKALEEITRNSGILYDPEVARACVTAFSESGFAFAAAHLGAGIDTNVPPSERHDRYSQEDH